MGYVDNATGNDGSISEDLKDQSAGNYGYDARGRLIRDTQNQIQTITWTAYDKVA